MYPVAILMEVVPSHGEKEKKKRKKKPPLVGLEPTTFELEVQCANPLRHRGILFNLFFKTQETLQITISLLHFTGYKYQSLLTICNIDKTGEDSYSIKVLKQKLLVDEREYILHEIFGLENKAMPKV